MKTLAGWLFVVFAMFPAMAAEIDWPQLQFPLVASNLVSPVHISHAGDGSNRLFIVEQRGTVRVLNGTNLQDGLFLDIQTNVITTGSERGLLSIAFPPQYSSKRYLYAYYTRKPDGAVTLSRFSLLSDEDRVDPSSEQVLLSAPHPNNNHNGGQMAFGPDGYLYLAIGDGSYGNIVTNPAQRLDSLLGKVLRIDTETGNPYTVPPTNPFLTNSSARPEIWAYGLRNPWRFSFDRQNGDLYLPDVGQVFSEEINFQPAGDGGGQNYGWPIYEGNLLNNTNFQTVSSNSLTYPAAVYSDPFNSCVVGGYVYGATNFARFQGIYFYGDFMQRRIYGMKWDEGQWRNVVLGTFPRMSAFGEDESGQIYVLDYYGGTLHRIEDSYAAAPPTFNPPGGNVTNNVITLNSLSPGSRIHYTLNGSDPTNTHPSVAEGESIIVTNSTVVRARTFRDDLSPSSVAVSTFTPTVAPIVFSPVQGPISNNTLVTLTSATLEAEIRYTTNFNDPTTNSFLYTGPFAIKGNTTLRAKGFKQGFIPSAVRGATYPWSIISTPVFTPASGFITNGTEITMFCASPGATIFYTTNGITPTTNSAIYTSPITIEGNTTVKAFGFRDGHGPSPIRSTLYALETVAAVIFSPSAGPITNGTSVSMHTSTEGASIYFTLDGSTPTTNSSPYLEPIVLRKNTVVNARAFKFNFNPSPVTSVSFEYPKLPPLTFTPSGGPITNGTPVSIASDEPGVTIFYTVDGSMPTTNSSVYSAPVVLSGNVTLSAVSVKEERTDSAIQSVYYPLVIYEKTIVRTIAGRGIAGFNNGTPFKAQFNNPSALCISSNLNIFVADSGNHRIRIISPDGQVATFAGTGVPSSANGFRTNASFNGPNGICLALDGSIFVGEGAGGASSIRKIDGSGSVTTIATFPFYEPVYQMEVAADNTIYFGKHNHAGKLTPQGQYSPISSYHNYQKTGVGIDGTTNVFATSVHRIVKISPTGTETVFAGDDEGFRDGPATQALFVLPEDCLVDPQGNVYISEGSRIRKIGTNGVVSTFAGNGIAGYANGSGERAQFNRPSGLAIDSAGNIYVADMYNHRIRRISIDSDLDEIPDFEEDGSPFVVGADDKLLDSDNDGQSNADEYIAGTDAESALSRFEIHAIQRVGSDLTLTWNGVASRAYTVLNSPDLRSWQAITNVTVEIQGETSVTLTNAAVATESRFYRIHVAFP